MRLTALIAAAVLTGGVATAQDPAAVEAQPPAAQASASSAIHDAKGKLSYALGVDLAYRLAWQRVDVDLELLLQGLRDAFAKDESRMLIPAKEAAATVKQFQAQRKRGIEHAMGMLSEKNTKAGTEFFAQNAKKEGVMTLPSGLQYKILREGAGGKPTLDDDVQCHYRGTLLDGTEFDSTYKRDEPLTFPLKRSIKGWQEALQLMPVGSKWQIVVPPQLAYGDRGNGMIGPNATLLFDVELVSIPERTQAEGTPESPSAKPGGGS